MAEDSKYKKLAKNSAIFFIGNMGSKLIAFFIVPFYTYVLTTEEYGAADLITTTVNLLVPFVMVGMNEAMLRFSTAREDDFSSLATNAMSVALCGVAVSWLLFPALRCVSVIGDQIILFLLLLNLTAFNYVFLQFLRGMGNSKAFALNGVLTTFVMAAANVVALAVLHLGVAGYLVSMVVAQAVGAVHIVLASKLWRYLDPKALDRALLGRMFRYCVPLIPNSLMWWIISASDRYVILFFMGVGANGLYNVAQKVPTLVNTVYAIFMQAWQISAIEERDSEDRSQFQSTVFGYVYVALAAISSLIAASAYPVYTFLMSASYDGAWQPVALLSAANFFQCIASFYGATYAATSKTRKAFTTTAAGAFINLALTLVLVPILGIMGAALATAASYAALALLRKPDMEAFAKIHYNKAEVVPSLAIILVQAAISFLSFSPALLCAQGVLFAALLVVLRRSLGKMFGMVSGAVGRKAGKRRG